jgi:FkbM family methyltransferase
MHLVAERRFATCPVRLVDVGSRGGAHAIWDFFEPDLEVIGFDPDAADNERNSQSSRRYIEAIVGRRRERRPFYYRDDPSAGNLVRADRLLERTLTGANGFTNEREVQTVGLDELELGLADFLKVDVDGAEIDVLNGGRELLKSVLGVEVEVHFAAIRTADAFADVDTLMRESGFALYDLEVTRYARAALPSSQLYDLRDSLGQPVAGPTEDGQVMFGNALYFRDPELFAGPPEQALKLACLFELHRLSDCAAAIVGDDADLIDLLRG